VKDEVLELAASLEQGSEHALGEAIRRKAADREMSLRPARGFQALPGLGVEGEIDRRRVLLGNRELMAERGVALGEVEVQAVRLEEQGKTPVFLAVQGRAAGSSPWRTR